jgi:hypothetical protein
MKMNENPLFDSIGFVYASMSDTLNYPKEFKSFENNASNEVGLFESYRPSHSIRSAPINISLLGAELTHGLRPAKGMSKQN